MATVRMVLCEECGEETPAKERFCQACGTDSGARGDFDYDRDFDIPDYD